MPPSTTTTSAANAGATRRSTAQSKLKATGSNGRTAAISRNPPVAKTEEEYTTATASDTASDSDDDEDEAAALQMDGQDLWNQNFCSVCDCLIPPGTGVGAAQPTPQPVSPTTSFAPPMSKTSSASSGLRSTTGTIKARPTSSEGPKRNSSSSSLAGQDTNHTSSGGIGRRQGSAGSRLNALSDLKPTTRINADQSHHHQQQRANSKSSRRTSTASVKSNSTTSSGVLEPESPSVTSSNTTLPRSRKGGLLAGLSPAALRQQEQEANQAKAPPALYCSERCRAIDERTSPSGLAELNLYSSQAPTLAGATTSSWASGSTWSPEAPFHPRVWPRTASTTSIPLAYSSGGGPLGGIASIPTSQTPDSEYAPCMCPECLDKLSASGLVPSGASDTTEGSSTGYTYGSRPSGSGSGYYRTQRSQSGRIVTPQNLVPPHGGTDDYFPPTGHYEPSSRRGNSIGSATGAPERTASAASARSGTDSSAQSMDSYGSIWEPAIKPRRRSRPHQSSQDNGQPPQQHSRQRGLEALPPSVINSERSSRHFDGESGTPAGSQITVSERERNIGSEQTRQRNSISLGTPHGSLPASSSPLRLLRSGDHRASPSVDVSGEAACSPAAHLRGPLSTSVASEHTLGTSAQTLVNRESSLRERRYGKGKSLLMNLSDASSSSNDGSRSSSRAQAGPSGARRNTDAGSQQVRLDPASATRGFSMSYSDSNSSQDSSALQHLKAASRRASALDGTSGAAGERDDSNRRYSSGSGIFPTASSGWLKSLSSALTSFRGQQSQQQSANTPPTIVVPPSSSPPRDHDSPLPPSSTNSRGRSISSVSPGARSGSATTAGSDATSASNLSRSAASESLSRMLANAALDKANPPSAVARPDANRGSVPAFAKEIGRGRIPGEAAANASIVDSTSSSSPRNRSASVSTSYKSATGGGHAASAELEEKRRRRAEHRHQRSKDVTVLPPLLAPSNRSGSALNLHNRANSYANLAQQRNRSRSRSSIGGGQAAFTVGSYSSSYTPSRPVTPGLTSPGLRTARATADGDSGVTTSPSINRVSSQQDVSSGARRPALGWSGSAMTPITSSPVESVYPRSIANGHAAHASQHLQHPQQHAHHHHHHHHHHQHHHSHAPRHVHSRHGHHQSASHAHPRIGHALGHLGTLGYHPHGSQPAYGRHNTMPVRSTTPIVPEHGGEMSGAALTGSNLPLAHGHSGYHGGHYVDRPQSAVGHRRGMPSQNSYGSLQPPSRPASSLAFHSSGAVLPHQHHAHHQHHQMVQPQPRWSYDNLANAERAAKATRGSGSDGAAPSTGAVKTYPLLQLPGREETHDRYDEAWSNAVELIAGPEGVKAAEEEKARRQSLKEQSMSHGLGEGGMQGGAVGSSRRKQLFHFG